MGRTEREIAKIINKKSRSFGSDPIIRRFIQADKEFNELVEKGLASRRGNNLLPKEDIHLRKYTFNSK